MRDWLNYLAAPTPWSYRGTDEDGIATYRHRITGRFRHWSWKLRQWL
jgi:hypothetical protein